MCSAWTSSPDSPELTTQTQASRSLVCGPVPDHTLFVAGLNSEKEICVRRQINNNAKHAA